MLGPKCSITIMPKTGCYCCGDLSHLVQEYPVRMDIKQLTVKQREELIEALNILKDVENLQQYELEEADPSDNEYKLLKQNFA